MRASACASQGKAEGGTRSPPPPPPKKRRGRGGARKQPTATEPPANTTRGGQIPHPEGTEDRTPKEAQGDHTAKTGNTKPGTAAHRKKGHRNMQTHTTKNKKKSQQPSPKERGWGDRDHKAQDRDTQQPTQKKAQKSHLDEPPKKGGAQPGPRPSTHAHTAHRNQKRRGASGACTRVSRPKPKPNNEHHKQPALEGQHHKPCPNTPDQDPSQDWRG